MSFIFGRRNFYTFALGILFLISGLMPVLASDSLILTYKNREIDSAPYFYDFPYRIAQASIEYEKLYFTREIEGEGKRLFVTDWDPGTPLELNSERATKVTDTDLNTINFWREVYNARINGLVARADDDKAERINLWVFADGATEPTRITDVDYVYNFTQSTDHSKIYFTARYGSSDAAKGCLEEVSVSDNGATSVRQLICDDNPAMPARINWWSGLRADEKRVIFPALKEGDRNKQELYAYDLSDGTVSLIFEGHGSSWLAVQEGWGGHSQMLISADRDLYLYNFETRKAALVRKFDRALSNFASVGEGHDALVLVTTETPFETRMELLKIYPDHAETISDIKDTADIWLADSFENEVLVGKFSPEIFASFELLSITGDGWVKSGQVIEGLDEVNARLSQCDVERVKVSYEDQSKTSPGAVDLDAYIFRPRDLPAIEDQKFIITAYYGGRNEFSSYHQLYCALGITTVSPAVRGDWRYGTEFANSNDREKADAPIRDVIAVARYLVERFSIPDTRQIGTTGYSHGGWASVRALAYPGPERFDFGFALAGGGFYDLLSVVDPTKNGETNIHGWFDKEFGTLNQPELLRSLSPSNNVDLINAPVFLYHGERDTRISVNQAKDFEALLQRAGKPVELLIIPDQGHSIRGPENITSVRQGILSFIEGNL